MRRSFYSMTLTLLILNPIFASAENLCDTLKINDFLNTYKPINISFLPQTRVCQSKDNSIWVMVFYEPSNNGRIDPNAPNYSYGTGECSVDRQKKSVQCKCGYAGINHSQEACFINRNNTRNGESVAGELSNFESSLTQWLNSH